MKTENIITFIASWKEDYGAKVIELYPSVEIFDYSTIATQIIRTYQFFYKKDANITTGNIVFNLPLVNINKRAVIFLETNNIEGKEGQTFIDMVVLLIPDFFPEERLIIFENIIQNIGMEYIETKSKVLEKNFDQIKEKFTLEQKVQDSDIHIDENYQINDALQDFKDGLLQFQQNELDRSYFLLRKAHMKFNAEDQLKLLLETTFLIGTILLKKNKFTAARNSFQDLQSLAKQLQHQKYHEKAIYLQGYCDYQQDNYMDAYKNLVKLSEKSFNFISKFQYCIIFGKILADMRQYENALKSFEMALQLSEAEEDTEDLIRKKGEIYIDLGHISYEMVYQAIKRGKLDKNTSQLFIQDSINYYKEAIPLWKKLDDYSGLIHVCELIADNYETLKEMEEAIKFHEEGLKYAELSNDLEKGFNILNKVISIYEELGLHHQIIEKMDILLYKIAPVAYLDLNAVAGFHTQLGKSFVELERDNEALSELFVALNIYSKFDEPNHRLLEVYNIIIKIYKKKDDLDHIQYYQTKAYKVEKELEELSRDTKVDYKPLEVVEELWIFTADGGSIFSYTPKSNTTPRLLSGFLLAMENFGSELGVDKIRSIKIGNYNFSYFKEPEDSIFMVGRANVKFKLDIVEEMVKTIYYTFRTKYQLLLRKFDGDATPFESFLDDIKKMS